MPSSRDEGALPGSRDSETAPTANLLALAAERTPDRVALQEVGGSWQTCSELYDQTLRWASAFEALGARPGDRIASMARAGGAYAPWVGAGWLRGIHVAIDPEMRSRLLVSALQRSAARILVIDADNLVRLAEVAGDLTELEHVVIVPDADDAPALPFKMHGADQLLSGAEPTPRPPVLPDGIDSGIFTSGTTGESKCVLRHWATDARAGRWLFPQDHESSTPDGAYYSPWPPFHALGLSAMAVSMQRDMRLVVRRRFSVENYWADIRSYGCTHSTLLVVAPLLLARPTQPDDAHNPLRYLTIVPLPREYREIEQRFGVQVATMYGQSETGAVLATADPIDFRTAGRPTAGMQLKLVDDRGELVSAGEAGELAIRPGRPELIADTYLGMPEAMQERWRGGWFHTGDAFRTDAEGNYYFVDRIKDAIRHHGHNVSSTEIEREISAHPAVEECACVGLPAELTGDIFGDQDVKAVIVRRAGAQLSAPEIIEFLADRVPPYMVPTYVEFVDEVPKTATNRIRKHQLKTLGDSVWRRPTR